MLKKKKWWLEKSSFAIAGIIIYKELKKEVQVKSEERNHDLKLS
jgi:hypothetical protein